MRNGLNVPIEKKRKANSLVNQAIRKGQIVPENCWLCNRKSALAHHEDYYKPYEIIWLCPRHHADRHKEIRRQEYSDDYNRRCLKES